MEAGRDGFRDGRAEGLEGGQCRRSLGPRKSARRDRRRAERREELRARGEARRSEAGEIAPLLPILRLTATDSSTATNLDVTFGSAKRARTRAREGAVGAGGRP